MIEEIKIREEILRQTVNSFDIIIEMLEEQKRNSYKPGVPFKMN